MDFFSVLGWVVLVAAVIGLVYAAVAARQADPKTRAAWEEAAARTGLTLEAPAIGYPELSGRFEGREVSVRASAGSQGVGGGKLAAEKTIYTAAHARPETGVLQLERTADYFLAPHASADPANFEELFQITGSMTPLAPAIFSDLKLRKEILHLNIPIIYVSQEAVRVVDAIILEQADAIIERLRLAVALAKALEEV